VKLITYRETGGSGVGVVSGDGQTYVDLAKAAPDLPGSVRGVLEMEDGLARARDAAEGRAADGSLAEITLLPVIPEPPAIWCVGVNYKEHQDETGYPSQDYPMLFLRIAQTLVAHGQPMIRPRVSERLDFEGELAVIIGKPGRHIAKADALSHVAGYACFNEGSVRDWQRHTVQYGPGKNFEGTGAFGPWMVTADEMGDPYTQTLTTRLNGEQVQHESISALDFRIENLIEYISTFTTMKPGDVISTGTPGGVGARREPPLWMKPGDNVEVEITGVGTLANPIAGEG
jgi:2-keto-4-pentenoate hydratase/2-oxohepta-3-ene-1,7-dioic acid hydratase in catechol pathway